ncbi:glycoside hydrolase [Hymenopellis radicata]|nr:glycoside hydrolase [Hymenopellis radicata]
MLPLHSFLCCTLTFLATLVHASCQSFTTTFSSLDGFTPLSPPNSYSTTGRVLELYLRKPDGPVKMTDGTNDKLGQGATLNSTFVFGYGKVSFEVSAPTIAGVITAFIMINSSQDEIDVELLGGDPSHWQTNMFAPPSPDAAPEYGTFSSIENVNNIEETHTYAIDWNSVRIEWSLDGRVVRTLMKEQTRRNGKYTYPTHEMRMQLGIWDGSGAKGTAAWAKGPIDWRDTPEKIIAVVRSVSLECGGA